MKASIDSRGTLTVQPETELESYALHQWWAHWGNAGSPVELNTKATPSSIMLKADLAEQTL